MKKYRTIKSKNGQPQGFTIIEVSLFLALTGLVLAGIISTFSSISRQRYNDSVQNFAEYLRGLYSDATNIQNNGNNCGGVGCTGSGDKACCGQSGMAIYGKVATFANNNGKQVIKSYNVIGNAHIDNGITDAKQALGSGTTISGTKRQGASIHLIQGDDGQIYDTIWQATIQNKDKSLFTGSILIARSPNSGAIHTYYSNSTIDQSTNLTNWLTAANETDINFCVYSDDLIKSFGSDKRRNIRIVANARNASGVELIANEAGDYACGN